MKKLLAMVLALVMTLSLAVSANAFKDDKSISDDYAEAVPESESHFPDRDCLPY